MFFEIGKGLHELSHIFPRQGIDGMPRAQIPDETREESFDCAHRQKRKVSDIMTQSSGEVTNLLANEGAKIDMSHDEFDTLYVPIKTSAPLCEETRTPAHFVRRKSIKAAEESERNQNKEKICHTS